MPDLEARRLRILHGKGNKQRVVPFADRRAAALGDYLRDRGNEPGPLFLAATHLRVLIADVPLQPNGLKQLLRRLGKRTGIKKVHAHRFRHTFATWAIQHLPSTPRGEQRRWDRAGGHLRADAVEVDARLTRDGGQQWACAHGRGRVFERQCIR